tara:strand:+ start:85 stop:339 length:255 start_codon:yes stop_codon:yes gene_type:complete
LEFKQRVTTNYPELFERGNEGELDYAATTNFGTKWGWYQSIYGIAKGDITKFDEVARLNVHKSLMFLAFEKEKLELEKKLIKKK